MEEYINEVRELTNNFSIPFNSPFMLNGLYGHSNKKLSSENILKYEDFVTKYLNAMRETYNNELKALKNMVDSGTLTLEEMALINERLSVLIQRTNVAERF